MNNWLSQKIRYDCALISGRGGVMDPAGRMWDLSEEERKQVYENAVEYAYQELLRFSFLLDDTKENRRKLREMAVKYLEEE